MFKFDKSNFVTYLKEFPYQIKEVQDIFLNFTPELNVDGVRNFVFAGMGGSAISSDLFISYAREELKYPAFVNRDYSIPSFVDEGTLFIATSYSGNTEETLTAVRSAAQAGARIIGISSGGALKEFCSQKNYLHLKVPAGLPPRQALGYLFFPLLFLFQHFNFISKKEDEIHETYYLLKDLISRYSPDLSVGDNLPNHIAQTLFHAVPVIYTASPYLAALPVRWRNQFNENSKMMAFSNIFPELNHNEIMGWEGPAEVNRVFRVIILRDVEESPRNKQRLKITKKILRGNNVSILEVFAEGKSRLARLFSLIATGDWASYYLAMLNEVEPIKIDSIDLLKNELSKIPE
ncbi:MAG: bifunctional phosphoglucose/phosphomannose isomerase [Calditrichia bacterium]